MSVSKGRRLAKGLIRFHSVVKRKEDMTWKKCGSASTDTFHPKCPVVYGKIHIYKTMEIDKNTLLYAMVKGMAQTKTQSWKNTKQVA